MLKYASDGYYISWNHKMISVMFKFHKFELAERLISLPADNILWKCGYEYIT